MAAQTRTTRQTAANAAEFQTSDSENSMIENKIEELEKKIAKLNEMLVNHTVYMQQMDKHISPTLQMLEKWLEEKANRVAQHELIEEMVEILISAEGHKRKSRRTGGASAFR